VQSADLAFCVSLLPLSSEIEPLPLSLSTGYSERFLGTNPEPVQFLTGRAPKERDIENHPSGVFIATHMSPTRTDVHAFAEVFLLLAATYATGLRGLVDSGRYLGILSSSFFRFVREHPEKHRWGRAEYFSIQSALSCCGHFELRLLFVRHFRELLGHSLDRKFLCGNQAIEFYEQRACLMDEIESLICRPRIDATYFSRGLLSILAFMFLAIEHQLRGLEFGHRVTGEPWISNRFIRAVGMRDRRECFGSPVEAYRCPPRLSLRLTVKSYAGVPASLFVLNLASLGLANRAGAAAHADATDAGEPDESVFHLRPGQESPAVAVCFVSPTREPIERLEARKACSITRLHSSEERLVREIKALQRYLARLSVETCVFAFRAEISKVFALLREAHPDSITVRDNTLFESGVIKPLMKTKHVEQRPLLSRARAQSISCLAVGHLSNYSLVMAKKQGLQTLSHCVFKLQYHLVLVTKYRRRCITGPMLKRLGEIFARLCEQWDARLLEFNGEPEHVHLLIEMNPKIQPSKFVNSLKTVSSRLIRKEFSAPLARAYQKPVFWSRSYCILTCGGAPLSVIKQYIEQQEGAE
jgi:putative transposase